MPNSFGATHERSREKGEVRGRDYSSVGSRPARARQLRGHLPFRCQQICLSDELKQNWVGLEEMGEGIWALYFYDVRLARLDERDRKLHARTGKVLPIMPV